MSERIKENLEQLIDLYNNSYDITIPKVIKQAIEHYKLEKNLVNAETICKVMTGYSPLLTDQFGFMSEAKKIPLIACIFLINKEMNTLVGRGVIPCILQHDSPAWLRNYLQTIISYASDSLPKFNNDKTCVLYFNTILNAPLDKLSQEIITFLFSFEKYLPSHKILDNFNAIRSKYEKLNYLNNLDKMGQDLDVIGMAVARNRSRNVTEEDTQKLFLNLLQKEGNTNAISRRNDLLTHSVFSNTSNNDRTTAPVFTSENAWHYPGEIIIPGPK